MGDAHVLEGDVELGGTLQQVGADTLRDGLTLGDELGGVELGDDGLENFVADGGEDSLVVVLAKGLDEGEGFGQLLVLSCLVLAYMKCISGRKLTW